MRNSNSMPNGKKVFGSSLKTARTAAIPPMIRGLLIPSNNLSLKTSRNLDSLAGSPDTKQSRKEPQSGLVREGTPFGPVDSQWVWDDEGSEDYVYPLPKQPKNQQEAHGP